MLFSIITLFPEMFKGIFDYSIIKRAKDQKLIKIRYINIRDFGIGRHKTVDDKPYGGGTGMILRVDVVNNAIQFAKKGIKGEKIILLDPKGTTYNQSIAENYSKLKHLILVCGHYEGFDERIIEFVDEVISIGNYVLSGGEIPAMTIIESVSRLIPQVLVKKDAIYYESFSKIDNQRILEYPQYTRPRIYKGKSVPEILLSGNNNVIEKYRKDEALKKTTRK